MSALHVLAAGPSTLIEDLGRPGYASLGVSTSGAMDRGALRLANRLVGNLEHAPALEALGGGLRMRASGPVWLAITGAWGDIRVDGLAVAVDRSVRLEDGATIEFAHPAAGLRYYVAVRGGIDADRILGSASTDLLSGLGPAPVRDGDVLPVGREPGVGIPASDEAFTGPPPGGPVRLGVRPGPRANWFPATSWTALVDGDWRVSPQSNRVGIRLDGTALERERPGELPSEGMVPGAIQVPPNGLPTSLAADHPGTGGYPVIAVVIDRDLDALAQLVPGQKVSFRLAAGRD